MLDLFCAIYIFCYVFSLRFSLLVAPAPAGPLAQVAAPAVKTAVPVPATLR